MNDDVKFKTSVGYACCLVGVTLFNHEGELPPCWYCGDGVGVELELMEQGQRHPMYNMLRIQPCGSLGAVPTA